MKKLITLVLLIALTLSTALVSAQTADWPKTTINMIVTHGAGGDTDFNGRLLSRLLEKKLGVSVVATNVTGANGNIALSQYKDSPNDGYTFILTNSAALVGNEVTGISTFGYDALEVVSVYGKQAGENIIVPADSPYENLGDLITASKEKPGTIRFGISTGGGVFLAATVMTYSGGAEFNVIDSGDGAARMTALLGGHVDATIVPYSTAREYIEAGQVKSLATLLRESPSLIPGIPPANEFLPGLIVNTLYVCLAPKGTDLAIIEKMNSAILDIVNNDAEYKEAVNSFNLQEPWALNVADSIAELESQRETFTPYADYLK